MGVSESEQSRQQSMLPRGKAFRGVQLHTDYVMKWGDPRRICLEAEKMKRAGDIAAGCRLFRVPAVLDVDTQGGILYIERIDGLRGIRRAGLKGALYLDAVRRTGMALRKIHQQLTLPKSMVEHLAPNLADLESPNVFLHGDLSGENVCILRHADAVEIVVLDWQVSEIAGGRGSFGTVYFDLAWFIGNLFRKPSYKYPLEVDPADAATSFLEGYAGGSISAIDHASLGKYLLRLLTARNEHEARLLWLKRVLLSHGLERWRCYAHSLINTNRTNDV